MDLLHKLIGILFVIGGIIAVVYRSKLSEFSTQFREKWMNIKYDDSVRKGNTIGYGIMGIVLIMFGLYFLLFK